MKKEGVIRWGFLSTADIGKKTKAAIDQSGRGKVVAIASRDAESAKKFREEVAKEDEKIRVYDSYEELLDDEEVEAVYLPLPSALRKEWAIKAAKRGKHVQCEKPYPSAKEIEEIAEACRESKVLFMDGTMFVHNPRTEEVRRMVREGELGQVNLSRAIFCFQRPEEEDDIRIHKELEPLGALGDVGWYATKASLISYQFELPERVFGMGTFFNGVINSVCGIMYFSRGRMAAIEAGFTCASQQMWSICGDARALNIDGFVIPWTADPFYFPKVTKSDDMPFQLRDGEGKEEVRHADLEGMRQESRLYQNYADLVQRGEHAGTSEGRRFAREALLTQIVLDHLRLSVERGAVVEIPRDAAKALSLEESSPLRGVKGTPAKGNTREEGRPGPATVEE